MMNVSLELRVGEIKMVGNPNELAALVLNCILADSDLYQIVSSAIKLAEHQLLERSPSNKMCAQVANHKYLVPVIGTKPLKSTPIEFTSPETHGVAPASLVMAIISELTSTQGNEKAIYFLKEALAEL